MTHTVPQRGEISASLRQLKLFEAVARLHSVRKASEECHLSQPAVTQAIAKLEEQVGVILLERRPSGTYLNRFGTIFRRRIESLFAQLDQALTTLGVSGEHALLVPGRLTRSRIRSLTSVVETGSFTEAARCLGVSQTSLRRAAHDLERVLGIQLYEQTASGIMATPAGAEFARGLKLAIGELDLAASELNEAQGDFSEEIVIGTTPFSGSVMLASVLSDFALLYPSASIRVMSGSAAGMFRALRAGDVHLVMGPGRESAPEDLVYLPLVETAYRIVGRRGHPLSLKGRATLNDISGFEWIIGLPGGNRRLQFERLFARGHPPKARLAVGSLPIVRLLLAESNYLTLLTSYELLRENGLTAIPFGPIEPAPSIGLTIRGNWLPTELQARFIELAQKQIGSQGQQAALRRAS